jgi:peptidoglycan-associated lipoprotein
MKKFQIFCCLLALSLAACQKQQKQEYTGVEGDNVNGTPLPPRQEGVSFFSNNVTKGQFRPIYFAFDSFEIAADEGNTLRQIASFLKAARNFLLSLGVSASRIQTVSFGQEMPANPGHDESAWAKNRRVETGVVR